MALSTWIDIAVVDTIIGAIQHYLSEMDGVLPFYIAIAFGLFVATSLVCGGWSCDPRKDSSEYKLFMRIYFYEATTVVCFTTTMILKEIKSQKLELIQLGVMIILYLSLFIHDCLVQHVQFQAGKSMYIQFLISHWAIKCGNPYSWDLQIPAFGAGASIMTDYLYF